MALDRSSEARRDLLALAHVHTLERRSVPDLACCTLTLIHAAGTDDHLRPLGSQALCSGQSDAGVAADDHSNLALEATTPAHSTLDSKRD